MKKWGWVTGVLWSAGLLAAAPTHAAILINELLADPPALTGDANRDGIVSTTQDEFIELVNTGAGSLSLTGWSLSDAVRVRHLFSDPSLIPAYGFFVVFGGGSPAGFAHAAIASTGTLSLNNAGDTVTLWDPDGVAMDALIYGPEGGHDVSLTRFPDATGAFIQHTSVGSAPFSPGATINGEAFFYQPPALPDPPAPLDLPSPDAPTVPEPGSLFLLGSGWFTVLVLEKRGRGSYSL